MVVASDTSRHKKNSAAITGGIVDTLKTSDGRSHSTVQQIQRATFILMGGTLLLNGISLIKSPFIAQYYGTSDKLDAYFLAFAPFNFISGILLSAIQAVLVPAYAEARKKYGDPAAFGFVVTFSGVILFAILALSGLLWIGSEPLATLLGAGFPPDLVRVTASLLRLSLIFLMLSVPHDIGLYFLTAHQQFTASALIPVAGGIFSLATLVYFHAQGIVALLYGLIGGILLQLALLVAAIRSYIPKQATLWPLAHPDMLQIFKQLFPLLLGSSFGHINVMVDQTMASLLAPGSIAALNYGNRLHTVFTQMFIMMISRAVLPFFAQQAAEHDFDALRKTFFLTLKRTLCVLFPLSIGIIVFGKPMVQFFFQRGAFTAQSTSATTGVWIAYTLGLPMQAVGILAARMYNVLRENKMLMYVAGGGVVVNTLLNWILMQFWGHIGIALSTSVVYTITTVVLVSRLYRTILKKATNMPIA